MNGTLNIIKQGEKLGVKNFSVISSIGAVWDRHNVKPFYTSDGIILLKWACSNGVADFLTSRLESHYKGTDSLRG